MKEIKIKFEFDLPVTDMRWFLILVGKNLGVEAERLLKDNEVALEGELEVTTTEKRKYKAYLYYSSKALVILYILINGKLYDITAHWNPYGYEGCFSYPLMQIFEWIKGSRRIEFKFKIHREIPTNDPLYLVIKPGIRLPLPPINDP